ncbi:MAG: hypothetical protein CMD33_03935 [Flavobacteriales bacterium]|nr:hypothetical protein [Flavobacteriales bacterium]
MYNRSTLRKVPKSNAAQRREPGGSSASHEATKASKSMVLYVWGSEERNSRHALEIAESSNVLSTMHVVDVRTIPYGDMPEWLQGVPSLLNIADEVVYEGTMCLEKLEELVPEIREPVQQFGSMQIRQRQTQMSRTLEERATEDPGRSNGLPPPIQEEKMSASQMKIDIKKMLEARDMN